MTAEAIASGKGNNARALSAGAIFQPHRDGRLAFGNEVIQLARNWPGVDHPMHGDGWAHAWQVVRSDARSAEIVYQHEPAGAHGGWPFRYRARQQYRLDEASFSIRIALENLEDRVVPAGIGLHPFFVREPDCTLTCRTAFVWRTDTEVLPIERIPVPSEWDFSQGRRPDSVFLDNCFDGWDGRAIDRLAEKTTAARPRSDRAVSPCRDLHAGRPALLLHRAGQPCQRPGGQAPLAAGGTLAGETVFRLSNL